MSDKNARKSDVKRKSIFDKAIDASKRLVIKYAGRRKQVVRLVYYAAVRRPWLSVSLFVFQMLAAVFEAGTMGIFAFAIATLVGDTGTSIESVFGRLGEYADPYLASMGKERFFLLLIGVGVFAQFARALLQYAATVATANLQTTINGDMRSKALRHVMSMSFSEVGRMQSGRIGKLVGQSGDVATVISSANKLIREILMLLAYVVVMVWISVYMTIGALVLAYFFSLIVGKLILRLQEVGERILKTSLKLSGDMVELLNNPKLVRIFARQDYAVKTLETAMFEGLKASREGQLIRGAIGPLLEFMTYLVGGAFIIGGYFLVGDEAPHVLPKLLVFLYVLKRVMGSVSNLNNIKAGFVQKAPALEKVAEFLDAEEKSFERRGGKPFKTLQQGISFEHVTFRYGGRETTALEDVTFYIPKGKMVALVGASGAGKSTIVDILLGLYEIEHGKVVIDGCDLMKINLRKWRDKIGIVSQDVAILHKSIGENIAFGKLGATEEEIRAAAVKARVHDFVEELPDRYDTIVGDQGFRVSGGQRQRIALARALIREPELLILDEATSALDSISERKIQEVIEKLHGELTIVSVAHRLSTIVHADQIIVLDRGRVVETGNHRELVNRRGVYANFWQLQSYEDKKDHVQLAETQAAGR